MQIKYQDTLACIDTIAIDSKALDPLQALLLNPAITKVFHAASQDLEIFYLMTRQVPTPLFDTQVAAPLLGYNEQIGYGNLVKEHLGIRALQGPDPRRLDPPAADRAADRLCA